MGITRWTRTRRAALAAALCTAVFAVSPACAATSTGQAKVAIVPPLTLVNTTDLAFGSIVPSTTGGTVTINEASGARTSAGGVTPVGGGFGAATFIGNTGPNLFVHVGLDSPTVTLNRSGGGGSMNATLVLEAIPITIFGNAQDRYILLGNQNVFTIHVGGTLTVGANQAVGAYSGTFTVTADYF